MNTGKKIILSELSGLEFFVHDSHLIIHKRIIFILMESYS